MSKDLRQSDSPAGLVRTDSPGKIFGAMFGGAYDRIEHLYKPYMNSVYLYTGITQIAEAIAGVPVRLMTRQKEVIDDPNHPVVAFIQQPNPYDTIDELISMYVTHLELDGQVFLIDEHYVPGVSGIGKREVYVATDSEITRRGDGGWEYRRFDGKKTLSLRADQVDLQKYYNPYDPSIGLSPARAAIYAIAAHHDASRANAIAMKKGGNLGNIYQTDQVLDEAQVKRIYEEIEDRHSGTENNKRDFIAWGGMSVDRGTQGLKDLDYLAGKLQSAKEIGAVLRVPPIMLGLFDEATYNNTRTQMGMFWSAKGLPLIRRRLRVALTRFLLRGLRNDFYIDFQTEEIEELKLQHAEFVDSVSKLSSRGFARNELNDRYNLGFETVPWGDEPLVGAGQLPITTVISMAKEALESEQVPEGEEKDKSDCSCFDALQRVASDLAERIGCCEKNATANALQVAWMASWTGLRRSTVAVLKKFFNRQKTDLINRLKTAPLPEDGKADEIRSSLDAVIEWVLFDLDTETSRLRKVLEPRLFDGLELGGEQIAEEIGVNYVVENPSVAAHLENQMIRLSQVNQTTIDRVRKTLLDGLKSGESLTDLSKRIAETMGSASTRRAYVIAQTELHESISAGRSIAMKESGVEGKAWLSGGDANVRASHGYAQQYTLKKAIAVDAKFKLKDDEGEEWADYPGDATLSPGNRVNCRCVSVARTLSTGKSIGLPERFLSWEGLCKKRKGRKC